MASAKSSHGAEGVATYLQKTQEHMNNGSSFADATKMASNDVKATVASNNQSSGGDVAPAPTQTDKKDN
jgi:hypothetical protein